MSISAAMNTALSGLSVSSRLADITSSNIANVSTPGYIRRSVAISEASYGSGASVDGIIRHTNDPLTQQRNTVSSNLAQSSVLSSAWTRLSASIGDTVDGAGLFQRMDDFQSAITKAANTPESSEDARAMLDAAKAVATELNNLSETVRKAREDADNAIYKAVKDINSILIEIDVLNIDIQATSKGSSHAASLQDQRQNAVDRLSQYLPVRTIPQDNGTVDVITQEGVFLLTVEVREVEFNLGAGYTPDFTLAGGELSGLTVAGVDLSPGGSSYGAVSSGELAGLFQLRDEDLPELSAQLDTIANDLISRFTDDVADPTLNPGDAGLFVDPNAPLGAGSASRIRVNSVVDPAQGGALYRLRDGLGAPVEGESGNSVLLNAMLDAMKASTAMNENGIQGRFTATELSAHISSVAGQKRVSNDATQKATQIEFDRLVEAENDVTKVDIDAEMQMLLMIEQAYAANARVIQATSQFMQTLMEL